MKTVGELIQALQEFPEDAPLMAAHQPSYPIQETICAVHQFAPECEYCGGENGHFEECENKSWYAPESARTVYVVLGGQPYDGSPYAPRQVFEG